MKIVYFDCFSGISGDMCLGAIIDAGVSLNSLSHELKKIPITGYRLVSRKVKRAHFSAQKVDIFLNPPANAVNKQIRVWKDVEKIIGTSKLPDNIKQKGLNIFRKIFRAEARVHGKTTKTVHLHELGAVDCMIDIFGTLLGLQMLGAERVFTSAVNLGSGFIKSDHGILPVPAPATAEILKKVPVYSKHIASELTTPTGAAIIRELSNGFGTMPPMMVEKIGIGAGSKNYKDWPNVLRILIGNSYDHSKGNKSSSDESICVVETNIDDMNPQLFEYVIDQLLRAGALDVYITQILMKKGRPGIKLSVLCTEEKRDGLIKMIFRETSTIGLRYYETHRKVLQRETKKINTEFGTVRIKFSKLEDKVLKATPEYEDCKRIAKQNKLPLIQVMKKINHSTKDSF